MSLRRERLNSKHSREFTPSRKRLCSQFCRHTLTNEERKNQRTRRPCLKMFHEMICQIPICSLYFLTKCYRKETFREIICDTFDDMKSQKAQAILEESWKEID